MVFLLRSGDKRSASSTLAVSGSEMSLGCGEKEEEDEGCSTSLGSQIALQPLIMSEVLWISRNV